MKKHRHIFGMIMALAIILPSCGLINDDFDEPKSSGGTTTTAENIILQVSVALPSETGSRSSTTDTGASTGEEQAGVEKRESIITNLQMYFYDASNDNFLLSTAVENSNGVLGDGGKLTISIPVTEFEKVIGRNVKLYLVANSDKLQHSLAKQDSPLNATYSFTGLGQNPLINFNSQDNYTLPIVNANDYEFNFTQISSSELSDYTEQNPLQIMEKLSKIGGSTDFDQTKKVISLERAVARIDYKDKDRNDEETPHLYELYKTKVKLQIYSMQVVNVSESSYVFRHSAQGNDSGIGENPQVNLFGTENGNTNYTWLVDNDYDGKKSGTDLFNSYSSEERGYSHYILPTELDQQSIPESAEPYHPWCYVSENIMPSTNTDNLKDHATGIHFRVLVCESDGDPIGKDTNLEGNEDLKRNDDGSLRVYMDGRSYKDVPWTGAVENADGTEKIPGGYYLDYYYFIKHNDPTVAVDPMEYAVVRNNIYQLSVTAFNSLPDPEDPEGYYMSVSIKVLPWVKRDITVSW